MCFVSEVLERVPSVSDAAAHLAAIVDASDRAILSMTPDGTVLTWNRAAATMYGYNSAEALGRWLAALVLAVEDRWTLSTALAEVAAGQVIRQDDVVHRRRDGTSVHASVTVAPLLDETGAFYGACLVARDLTDEHRMAAQLAASLAALAEAAAEACQSEARTRRFLDDAAHQLRSPITSIRACAETLALGVTPTQQDRLLKSVCRESERAGRLMAGLLRMARLDHEQALLLRPTDVLTLCEEQAERARVESPHLDVIASSASPCLGWARLATDAVGEILSNLVDNASRHAATRIDIRAHALDHGVEFHVQDDGPGLPDGQSERAFERFVSLDGQGGSGLGLPIARELARAYGGDVTYEVNAFVLRLPCELEPAAVPACSAGTAHFA